MFHIDTQVALVVDPKNQKFGEIGKLIMADREFGNFDVLFAGEVASYRYSDGLDEGKKPQIHVFFRARTYQATDGIRRSTYTDLETTYVSMNLGTESALAKKYEQLFGEPPEPPQKR